MQTTLIKILFGILALVVIVQIFTLYKLSKIESTPSITAAGETAQPTPTQQQLAGVTIGGPAAADVSGIITQANDNSIEVKDTTGVTKTISINNSTKVQVLGQPKDVATQQKELAAYNAKVNELMKDPQANKAALAALQTPSTLQTTPGTLSDLKAGDSVAVFTNGSSNTATLINVSTNVAPPTSSTP